MEILSLLSSQQYKQHQKQIGNIITAKIPKLCEIDLKCEPIF